MRENGKNQKNATAGREEKSVTKIVEEVREKGKILLDQGISTAKEKWEEGAQTVRKKADELSEKTVDELTQDLQSIIRQNPLKSVAIAFGLGAVLGSLFKSD